MHTKGQVKIDDATDLPLAIIEDTEDGVGLCEIGASDSTKEMASSQEKANARRLVALWNMADRLNLSTEFIEDGGVDEMVEFLQRLNAHLINGGTVQPENGVHDTLRAIFAKLGGS